MRNLPLLLLISAALLTAQQRRDYLADYAWQPGGAPEDRLWQVLILLGPAESGETRWDGSVSVAGGEIFDLVGYRFEPPDRVLPQGGWRLTVRPEVMETGVIRDAVGGSEAETVLMPKGLLIRGQGAAATRLRFETPHGEFEVFPAQVDFGDWSSFLNGLVSVQRTPAVTDLSGTDLRQHDFPSLAGDDSGGLSAVWMSYHDRREELNFRIRTPQGRWSRLAPVPSAEDLWRPQVAVDGKGSPWLIWSHRPESTGPGNWDLYARSWDGAAWGDLARLTRDPLPDIEPAVARAPDGTIYVAWQALRGRASQIRLKYLRDGRWSETISVTNTAENNWEPAIAAGPDSAAWIAWDRYDGDYNVYVRRFSPSGGLGDERQVVATPRFEAHVSVAVDSQNRPWVAWETDAVNWGKDYGFYLGENSPGAPLMGRREVEIAALDGEQWKRPAPLRFDDPLAAGVGGLSGPRLWFDPDGNPWLAFKRTYARRAYRAAVHWESFLTRLDGDRWTEPILLPSSTARKSTRLSIAAAAGRLWAFWPHDSREWAFSSRPHSGRVVAGSIELPGAAQAPQLGAWSPPGISSAPADPNEAENVRIVRSFRAEYQGETRRILRADLHRHTEFSQDQGGLPDGSLPDFYRYMIDVANMDFGASTDHQAGGTDYWNFITQKMTDMYHFPERYSTLYAYERNPGNPHGHRNLIYTHRDYPIVPFFQRINPDFMLPDSPDGELLTFNSNSFGGVVENDTELLHRSLRESEGLAIPHTPASTGMGTDWHAFDPGVDAVVEIYQGDRINSEHEGAPRWQGKDGGQPGGWQAPGQVWNAWKKGYKIGVIASSDHMSTHISYAMVYSPSAERHDIWKAIQARHTYGATDNIVLEFRIGDCLMGDECQPAANEPFRVRVRGTDDVAAIHLIRDAEYIYKAEPGRQEVELEYLDQDAGPGEHWYYVRIEQADEELAWSSPIWVTRK